MQLNPMRTPDSQKRRNEKCSSKSAGDTLVRALVHPTVHPVKAVPLSQVVLTADGAWSFVSPRACVSGWWWAGAILCPGYVGPSYGKCAPWPRASSN